MRKKSIVLKFIAAVIVSLLSISNVNAYRFIWVAVALDDENRECFERNDSRYSAFYNFQNFQYGNKSVNAFNSNCNAYQYNGANDAILLPPSGTISYNGKSYVFDHWQKIEFRNDRGKVTELEYSNKGDFYEDAKGVVYVAHYTNVKENYIWLNVQLQPSSGDRIKISRRTNGVDNPNYVYDNFVYDNDYNTEDSQNYSFTRYRYKRTSGNDCNVLLPNSTIVHDGKNFIFDHWEKVTHNTSAHTFSEQPVSSLSCTNNSTYAINNSATFYTAVYVEEGYAPVADEYIWMEAHTEDANGNRTRQSSSQWSIPGFTYEQHVQNTDNVTIHEYKKTGDTCLILVDSILIYDGKQYKLDHWEKVTENTSSIVSRETASEFTCNNYRDYRQSNTGVYYDAIFKEVVNEQPTTTNEYIWMNIWIEDANGNRTRVSRSQNNQYYTFDGFTYTDYLYYNEQIGIVYVFQKNQGATCHLTYPAFTITVGNETYTYDSWETVHINGGTITTDEGTTTFECNDFREFTQDGKGTVYELIYKKSGSTSSGSYLWANIQMEDAYGNRTFVDRTNNTINWLYAFRTFSYSNKTNSDGGNYPKYLFKANDGITNCHVQLEQEEFYYNNQNYTFSHWERVVQTRDDKTNNHIVEDTTRTSPQCAEGTGYWKNNQGVYYIAVYKTASSSSVTTGTYLWYNIQLEPNATNRRIKVSRAEYENYYNAQNWTFYHVNDNNSGYETTGSNVYEYTRYRYRRSDNQNTCSIEVPRTKITYAGETYRFDRWERVVETRTYRNGTYSYSFGTPTVVSGFDCKTTDQYWSNNQAVFYVAVYVKSNTQPTSGGLWLNIQLEDAVGNRSSYHRSQHTNDYQFNNFSYDYNVGYSNEGTRSTKYRYKSDNNNCNISVAKNQITFNGIIYEFDHWEKVTDNRNGQPTVTNTNNFDCNTSSSYWNSDGTATLYTAVYSNKNQNVECALITSTKTTNVVNNDQITLTVAKVQNNQYIENEQFRWESSSDGVHWTDLTGTRDHNLTYTFTYHDGSPIYYRVYYNNRGCYSNTIILNYVDCGDAWEGVTGTSVERQGNDNLDYRADAGSMYIIQMAEGAGATITQLSRRIPDNHSTFEDITSEIVDNAYIVTAADETYEYKLVYSDCNGSSNTVTFIVRVEFSCNTVESATDFSKTIWFDDFGSFDLNANTYTYLSNSGHDTTITQYDYDGISQIEQYRDKDNRTIHAVPDFRGAMIPDKHSFFKRNNWNADDNYYAIVTRPNDAFDAFYEFYDHTTGIGNGGMLVVNFNKERGQEFYEREFTVDCDSSLVIFSTFVSSARDMDQVQFSSGGDWHTIEAPNMMLRLYSIDAETHVATEIDSAFSGDIRNHEHGTGWVNLSTKFMAKDPGIYKLVMENNRVGQMGNDVCFDDISITICYPKIVISEDPIYVDETKNYMNVCAEDTATFYATCQGGIHQFYNNPYYLYQYRAEGETDWTDIPDQDHASDACKVPMTGVYIAEGTKYRAIVCNNDTTANWVVTEYANSTATDEQSKYPVPICHRSYGAWFDFEIRYYAALDSVQDTVAICHNASRVLEIDTKNYPDVEWYDEMPFSTILAAGTNKYAMTLDGPIRTHYVRVSAGGYCQNTAIFVTILDKSLQFNCQTETIPTPENGVDCSALYEAEPIKYVSSCVDENDVTYNFKYSINDTTNYIPWEYGQPILVPQSGDTVHWIVEMKSEEQFKDTIRNTCEQVIYITDATKPIITCSSTITEEVESGCEKTFDIPIPSVLDNCTDGKDIELKYSIDDENDFKAVTDSIITVTLAVDSHLVHWVAIDTARNISDTCSQNVIVKDTIAPIIVNSTGRNDTFRIGSDCDTIIKVAAPEFVDNCNELDIQYTIYYPTEETETRTYTDTISIPIYVGVNRILWEARDNKALPDPNPASVQDTFVLEESIAPIIHCSDDTFHYKISTQCDTILTISSPEITDNCEVKEVYYAINDNDSIPYTGAFSYNFELGITKIRWIAKDFSNRTECTDIYNISDSSSITISCPNLADSIVTVCSSKKWEEIENLLENYQKATAKRTDCANGIDEEILPEIFYKKESDTNYTAIDDNTLLELNTRYDIKWLFTKSGENLETMKDSCFNTIVLKDIVPPTTDCSLMKDITLKPRSSCDTLYTILKPEGVFDDNCSEENLTYYYKIDNASDSTEFNGSNKETFSNGSHIITWRVKDLSGNLSDTCHQTIYVYDSTAFQKECPTEPNVTINVCEDADWEEIESLLNDNQKATAKRYDCANNSNVDVEPQLFIKEHEGTNEFVELTSETTLSYNTLYDIKWLFEKDGDNMVYMRDSCLSTIKLYDTEAPTADCSKMTVISLSPSTACDTAYIISKPENVFDDNCLEGNLTYYYRIDDETTFTELDGSAKSFTNGPHSITWMVKDKAGNESSTCEQSVTVFDSTAFSKTCPTEPDVTINACDDMVWSNVFSLLTNSQKATATRKDCSNNTNVSVEPTLQFKKQTEAEYKTLLATSTLEYNTTYDIKWLFTKSDTYIKNMADSCFSTILLRDTGKPTADCSKMTNVTLQPKATCDTIYSPIKPTGVFTDNCIKEENLIFYYKIDDADSFTLYDASNTETFTNGTHTIYWMVKDSIGNSSDICQQTITVEDKSKPSVICQKDTIIRLATSCHIDYEIPGIIALDNCNTALEMTYFYQFNDETTATQYTEGVTKTLGIGEYTITWYAMDASSNKSDICSSNILVKDSTGFNMVCPTIVNDTIVTCDKMTWKDISNKLGSNQKATATQLDCKNNIQESIEPKMFYKKQADSNFSTLSEDDYLDYNTLYDIKWFFLKEGSNIETMKDSCFSTIILKDTIAPSADCSKMGSISLKPASCDTLYALSKPTGVFDDNCGEVNLTYLYKVDDAESFTTFNGTNEESLSQGAHTITWKVQDKTGNVSITCEQNITVYDSIAFQKNCPTEPDVTINTCTDMTWNDVFDTLTDISQTATAQKYDCSTKSYITVDPQIYYKEHGSAESDYALLESATTLTYNIKYDIKWLFVKNVTETEVMKDSCLSTITLHDTVAPTADCSLMQNITLNTKASCDTTITIAKPVDVFDDNCGKENLTYFFSVDDEDFAELTTSNNERTFTNGSHIIAWKVKDLADHYSDTCHQSISIFDSTAFNMTCPDEQNVTINTCGDMNWNSILSKLDAKQKATATRNDCSTHPSSTIDVDPKIFFKKRTEDDSNYTLIDASTTFSYNTEYDIKWFFEKESEFMKLVKDSCLSTLILKDTSVPTVDCSLMNTINLKPTVSCDTSYQIQKPEGVFDDNCDEVNLTYFYKLDDADFSEFDRENGNNNIENITNGSHTIVWKVTDKMGNESATCDQTITVVDETNPSITCPNDTVILLADECTVDYVFPVVSATDNCTVTDKMTYFYKFSDESDFTQYATNATKNLGIGEFKIFWYAKDSTGNISDTCNSNIIVKDSTQIYFRCPTAKDVTIDTCGNLVWSEIYKLYSDDQKAIATKKNCAENKTEPIDPVFFYKETTETDFAPMADNTELTYNTTYDIMWVFTKSGENMSDISDTCYSTVILSDTTKPSADCEAMQPIVLKPVASCDTAYQFIKPEGVFTDNCNVDDLTFFFKLDNETEFTQFDGSNTATIDNGTHTIVWKVQDKMGNESITCDQTVTVVDEAKPSVTCPNDTVILLADECTVDYVFPRVTATDNCTATESMTYFYKFSDESDFTQYATNVTKNLGIGEFKVFWYAKDATGNMSDTCNSNIVVKDSTQIDFHCPTAKDVTIDTCGNLVWSEIYKLYSDDQKAVATRKNCSENTTESIDPTFFYKETSETDFAPLANSTELTYNTTYDIMWVFTKSGENMSTISDTCYSTVILSDTTKPSADCEAMQPVVLKPVASCDTAYQFIKPEGVFTDNCNIDELTFFFKLDDATTFTQFDGSNTATIDNGTHTIVWKVQDKMGNESITCDQTVTVVDEAKPSVTCPNDTVILLADECTVDYVFPRVTATDNCTATESMTYFYKFSDESDFTQYETNATKNLGIGEFKVFWYAKDATGNMSDTCNSNIVVKDSTQIDFHCPTAKDVTIDTCGNLVWSEIYKLYSDDQKAVATRKNCSENTTESIDPTFFYKETSETDFAPLADNTELTYNTTYDIMWVFTKSGENMSAISDTCYSTVILSDTTKPSADCEAMQPIVLKPMASCDTAYQFIKPEGVFSDNCNVDDLTFFFKLDDATTFTQFDGSNTATIDNGTHTIVWKVQDKMGNESITCDQTVTVVDEAKPSVTCPNDTVILLADECNVDYVFPRVTATDNCTATESMTYFYKFSNESDFTQYETNASKNLGIGEFKVFWYAKDATGNMSDTCNSNIVVKDSTQIDFHCPTAKDVTIDTCGNLVWSEIYKLYNDEQKAVATRKNCSENTTESIDPTFFYKETSETDFAPLADNTELTYNTTYDIMWVFTKSGANMSTISDTCYSTVVLKDTANPFVDCNAMQPIVLHTKAACDTLYTILKPEGVFNDNCGEGNLTYLYKLDGAASFTEFDNTNQETFTNGAHKLVWKVQDQMGNTSDSCIQNITVNDSTAFDKNCPAEPDVIIDTCSNLAWKNVFTHYSENQKATAKRNNCATNDSVSVDPQLFIKESSASSDENFVALTDETSLEYNTSYDIKWLFVKNGEYMDEIKDSCISTVILKDTSVPTVDCSKMEAIVLQPKVACDTAYMILKPADVFNDNCGEENLTYLYKLDDAASFTEFDNTNQETFTNGEHKLAWKVQDQMGNTSDICIQSVTVSDSTSFDKNCPEEPNVTIDTCINLTWDNIYVLLTDAQKATATRKDCSTNTDETVEPQLFFKKKSEATFDTLKTTSLFEYNTDYDIKWLFVKGGEYIEDMKDSCLSTIILKDTSVPTIDCSKMAVITLQPKETCDSAYVIVKPEDVFDDNCGEENLTYFYFKVGSGATSYTQFTGSNIETFENGTHTLLWKVEDKMGNLSDSCEQTIIVEDVAEPSITCPNDTVILLTTSCDVDYKFPRVDATDNCTGAEKMTYFYKFSNESEFTQYAADATKNLGVGEYTISWFAKDSSNNNSDTCQSFVIVKDSSKINIECPTPEPITIDTCGNLVWSEAYKMLSENQKAHATRTDCANNTIIEIEPQLFYKETSETDYTPMTEATELTYNTAYDIKWLYIKSGENMSTLKDSCFSMVTLKDTTTPSVDCSKMEAIVLQPDSKCDTSYIIIKPEGVFNDNCGEGNLTYFYKVDDAVDYTQFTGSNQETLSNGSHIITWFVKDEFQSSDTCHQSITVTDTIHPIVTCPNDTVIKVLDGCDIIVSLNAATASDPCGISTIQYSTDNITFVNIEKATLDTTLEVGEHTFYWRSIDVNGLQSNSCATSVTIADTTRPILNCPDDIQLPLTDVCSTDITLPKATASDNCTIQDIYYSFDNISFETVTDDDIIKNYGASQNIVYWFAKDVNGNVSDTCQQRITILDNRTFTLECPTIEGTDPFVIETCGDLEWANLNDSLAKMNMTANAYYEDCQTNISTPIDSLVVKYSETGSNNWITLAENTLLQYNKEYTIRWIYTKSGENIVTVSDSCELPIVLKDTTIPVFDCATINPDSVVQVLDGICEIPFSEIIFNKYTATDNCDINIDGVLSWSEDIKDSVKATEKFEVGKLYQLKWIFIDKTNNQVTCDQMVMLNSNIEPKFNCDSLKEAVIDTVLKGVCEISAADLNVNTPFALDACTNDTIWGQPSRRSGANMTDAYKVGRDTIDWKFISVYSTDTAYCEQYVFIQSDMAPEFDCDSLKKAVIDTVLKGVCEISAADLNINTPFALDACTNDTIWGQPSRRSGANMTDAYKVGRDTIDWKFTSEYSTEIAYCEQYVFIQSDMAPEFDCDSLKKAVIDTVLKGVCEISAADLNINTPFALDACTNDTIWGQPSRRSGANMTDAYKVGRDTIDWKFFSEYSTDTAYCEQYVFIQSDMAPEFDCDSLKETVIDTVLKGVCEISAADLNVITPFALDACTNDTIWGQPSRRSGANMTDAYKVGRDTIDWKFFSEYSTDTAYCEQYVFIQSDMAPEFDCDSLKEAVIDTVLKGVCEISAADLNVNTPFALDACTNDTIWGQPSRRSGANMTDAYKVGRDTIDWKFISEYSTEIAYCEQYVFIQSDMAPEFDCDSLKKAVIDTVLKGVCEISAADLNVITPFALDACTNDTIWGQPSRRSGANMTDAYKVGRDTIDWKFFSEYSTDTAYCEQYVFIQSDMAPKFNCDSLKESPIEKVLEGVCEISAVDLNVNTPFALDACTNDTIWGVGRRTSGKSMTDNYTVGHDTIVWIFNSEYSTIADTCEQYVFIQSNLTPKFDCNTLHDTILYLGMDQCELPGAIVSLPIPNAKDACTDTDVPGVPSRQDGKEMTDNYPKDTTLITWTFTSIYSTQSATCTQKLIVVDTIAPTPNCDALDTIRVQIAENSTYFDSATYAEAVEAGLRIPTMIDTCDGEITAVGTREDGKPLESVFPIGNTIIQWKYTDKSGNSSVCPQVLLVEDWVPDTLYCPGDLDGKAFACLDEVPEAYKTFAEFKTAGGSFSNEKKMDANTFYSEDSITNDSCDMVITRTYHVIDLKGYDITCEEVIYVKDTIAPVFNVRIEDRVISCTELLPLDSSITATDNCDPAPIVTITETSNQSTDPSSCEYYSYDIIRFYTAKDRCGNENKQRQMILVRDTIAPTFDLPEDWGDYILAKFLKKCLFEVPNITDIVKGFVHDNCSPDEYLKIVQIPSAGSTVHESTTIKVYVYDACGNVDSLSKPLKVQDRISIAHLYAFDVDSCVTDDQGVTLANKNIRYATGRVEMIDDFDGSRIYIPSTFVYEYYKGKTTAIQNILYTNNEEKNWNISQDYLASLYGSADRAATEMTKLTQRSESGYYTMVALDTISGCTDTATIYVNIKERPKVVLESATIRVCEGNMVDLDPYVSCIDNMGADSLWTYWMKNNQRFDFKDSTEGLIAYDDIDNPAIFYAENECGVTSSLNSHLAFCNSTDTAWTTEDTLAFLNNDSIALEMLRTNMLLSRDSITFDVHKRYTPENIIINTDPSDPARIWRGESIELSVYTPYEYEQLSWYKVVGEYDRQNFNSATEHDEFLFNNSDDEEDELISILIPGESTKLIEHPADTTSYYVTVSDGVCPAVSSGTTTVAVLPEIPTAFTPHTKDGLNDVFMKHHYVVIFDRYGSKVFEGNDGWDGTFRGGMADPGVYYHNVRMGDGSIRMGTIEIIKIK